MFPLSNTCWCSTDLFYDGLHLTAAGYAKYWACLKPQVSALRDASRAARNSTQTSTAGRK